MPSFRRRASVIDADTADEPQEDADRPVDAGQARALAEEAEAEAAEAEAMAAAAKARARALRLRREAESAEQTIAVDEPQKILEVESAPAPESEAVDEVADTEVETLDADEADAKKPSRWRRLPRPNWKAVAATLVVVAILALLGLSGFFVWHHRQDDKIHQRNAEYSAAARQSVVTLMSLDFSKAQDDVQRIIDNSTGQFKDDFQSQAKDFVKVAQDSKVITEVTVNSTAVKQMDDDTANVLVAASSRVTNSAGAKQEPRTWRLSVNLQREGGQIKMSKVEFVP